MVVCKWKKHINEYLNFRSNGLSQKKKQMKKDNIIWSNGRVQIKKNEDPNFWSNGRVQIKQIN